MVTKAKAARIFIVDDHPLIRKGLVQIVNQQSDMTVCGEAEDIQAALDGITKAKPDAVVVDISLKGRSGLELIKTLSSQNESLPILALSMHDETLYAERAVRAGARGYIMKGESTDQVMAAIRRVLTGRMYMSERMSDKMLDQASHRRPKAGGSPMAQLSDRELEVFQLIGQGRSTREVADMLHLSVKTIETYRAHLMEKLRVDSPTELIRQAVHWVQSTEAA